MRVGIASFVFALATLALGAGLEVLGLTDPQTGRLLVAFAAALFLASAVIFPWRRWVWKPSLASEISRDQRSYVQNEFSKLNPAQKAALRQVLVQGHGNNIADQEWQPLESVGFVVRDFNNKQGVKNELKTEIERLLAENKTALPESADPVPKLLVRHEKIQDTEPWPENDEYNVKFRVYNDSDVPAKGVSGRIQDLQYLEGGGSTISTRLHRDSLGYARRERRV